MPLFLNATLDGSSAISLTWSATGGPYAVWHSAQPYTGYTALVAGLTSPTFAVAPLGNQYFEVTDTPLGAVSTRVGYFSFALQPGSN